MDLKLTKYSYLQQKFENNIFSYAYYMLRNRMDAEDTTQEVLIKIWENISKFNILAARTWIIRTTHNLCIDKLRKRKNSSYKEISIDEEFTETYKDDNNVNNPMKETHVHMVIERVKDTIKHLPETLKSVFVLYEVEGMKYREISSSLDIPINSVKVYLMRARKKLQEELKEYELYETN